MKKFASLKTTLLKTLNHITKKSLRSSQQFELILFRKPHLFKENHLGKT
jgi:hypothetical protein